MANQFMEQVVKDVQKENSILYIFRKYINGKSWQMVLYQVTNQRKRGERGMCKKESCRTCPYRTFEDSDVFHTTPVCQLQCEEKAVEHKKSED